MLRKVLSILLSIMIVSSIMFTTIPLTASAETSGDYEYVILSDGTAEITGYSGSDYSLIIPSEIDGNTVTSIGDYAFYKHYMDCVNIPESVTQIGIYALGYVYSYYADGPARLNGFTIDGVKDTAAQKYAEDNGFDFNAVPSIKRYGDFEYWIDDDGSAVISNYYGSEMDLTIPSEIAGYTVSQVSYPMKILLA